MDLRLKFFPAGDGLTENLAASFRERFNSDINNRANWKAFGAPSPLRRIGTGIALLPIRQ